MQLRAIAASTIIFLLALKMGLLWVGRDVPLKPTLEGDPASPCAPSITKIG